MLSLKASFDNVTGKIKPMHGGNFGPRQGGASLGIDFSKEFSDIGVPFARLHDVEYPYGQNQYVDIHCIFPNFDADETLPESYNFKATDKYLDAIRKVDCEVFYRLGESIDHFDNKLFIHPPKDPEKWARICEHIIMHYNEGWADGFEWGIKYWEIWNEPDNFRMWSGTHEEFFNLYSVTANHLKSRFGDTIKVGGYAASGYYMMNREDASPWFKTLVPYMNEFFSYITAEKTKAPMDFYSWHCYANDPEEVALHAEYAREMLDRYGIKNCENILNEFNFRYCFSEFSPFHKGCFADIAASMILAQKSSMDVMMHYDFQPRGTYNNIFVLDIDGKTVLHYAGFESMRDFGTLYRLGNEVETSGDIEKTVNLLAAKNDTQGGIMVVSRDYSGEVVIDLSGAAYTSYTIKRTVDGDRGMAVTSVSESFPFTDNRIVFNIDKPELVYIDLK